MLHEIKKTKTSLLNGFTMIEVLVVVSIAMVMTVVLFNARNNDSSAKEVDAAANQVVAELRSLQSDALNGREINGVVVSKFKFMPGADSTTYKIAYVDSSGADIPDSSVVSEPLKRVGLSFEVPVGDIIFTSPLGTASGANKLTVYAGDNLVSAPVKTYIMISSSGAIDVSKTGVFAATSCVIPGHTILSGDSLRGYKTASVACGGVCESAERVCVNGDLSNAADYPNDSCTPDPCPCNLGVTQVASGGSILAAKPISVSCGIFKCDTKSITCNDGLFSDLTYLISSTDATCQPDACQACTSWTLTPTQACQPGGTQTVSASNPLPSASCVGTPPTTQACTYVAPPACSEWTEVPPCVNYDSSGTCLDATVWTCTANCGDGLKNGNETGVDCGGSCGACTSTWTRLSGSFVGDSCFDTDIELTGTTCSTPGELISAPGNCWWDDNSQACPNYNCDFIDDLICGTPQTCTAGVYSALWPCQPSGTTWQSLITATPLNCVGGGPFAATINTQTCVYTPPPICSSWDSSGNCLAYCNDLVMNGDETGVDCGGSCSSVCGTPTCTSWTKTPTQVCQSNGLQTISTSNPLPAGCSGGTPPTTQACTYVPPTVCSGWVEVPPCVNYDSSGTCLDVTTWVCNATCSDGTKNGNETGVDCGGSCGACVAPPKTWQCWYDSAYDSTSESDCNYGAGGGGGCVDYYSDYCY